MMGHNVDLKTLLGLPEYHRCPICKELTPTYFDEYDIDCGDLHPKDGKLWLDIQCVHCHIDFRYGIKIDSAQELWTTLNR
jgi:hypothetical protein